MGHLVLGVKGAYTLGLRVWREVQFTYIYRFVADGHFGVIPYLYLTELNAQFQWVHQTDYSVWKNLQRMDYEPKDFGKNRENWGTLLGIRLK